MLSMRGAADAGLTACTCRHERRPDPRRGLPAQNATPQPGGLASIPISGKSHRGGRHPVSMPRLLNYIVAIYLIILGLGLVGR